MGALAVRQVVPSSLGQADDEPGVSGPPWAGRPVPIDHRGMESKPPFRTPVFTRRYIQKGITQAGLYTSRREPAPMIPLPIRSSLAQVINRHVFRNSHYVSWIKPFGMAPGYPVAKVRTLLSASRRVVAPDGIHRIPRPMVNRAGTAPAQPRYLGSGVMTPPRRFRKALPAQMVTYNPPVYGQES